MRYLESGKTGHIRVNVGTGTGASVLEVIAALESALGRKIDWQDTGRRAGDPTALAADVSAAASILNWKAKFGLREIVESAWKAWPKS